MRRPPGAAAGAGARTARRRSTHRIVTPRASLVCHFQGRGSEIAAGVPHHVSRPKPNKQSPQPPLAPPIVQFGFDTAPVHAGMR